MADDLDDLERDDLDTLDQKTGKPKKSFVLYIDSDIIFNSLSDEDAGRLIKSIFDYEATGVLPENVSGAVSMGFTVIRHYLDENDAKYAKKRKTLAVNGQRGGLTTQEKRRIEREVKANASKCLEDQADNDIEHENVVANVYDSVLHGERVEGPPPGPAPGVVHSDKTAPFDWTMFEHMIRNDFARGMVSTSYTPDEVLSVFSYYLKRYQEYTGHDHPHITNSKAIEMIEKMAVIDDDKGGFDVSPDVYPELIDRYFDTPMGGDRNINHFFAGDIRLLRYHEWERESDGE